VAKSREKHGKSCENRRGGGAIPGAPWLQDKADRGLSDLKEGNSRKIAVSRVSVRCTSSGSDSPAKHQSAK
jgi:hypothetical protein